nr:importin subunit beta-2 [Quercus suber]
MLKQAKTSPDINNYLAYVTVTATAAPEFDQKTWHAARSAAAIMLKNNVKTSYQRLSETSQKYIKSTILAALEDPNAQIRNYVGIVVTEVIKQGGILGWPEVLPNLTSMVSNGSGQMSPEGQDGAMGALFKICEDNRRALDQEYQTQRPLAFLLPKFLEFTHNQNPKIRSRALASINIFFNEPVALTAKENINDILPAIVRLTADTSDDVRRVVCRSFALLADGMPAVLTPHIEGIVDYTLSQQRDADNEELALDAAEFFFEASGTAKLRGSLGPFLDRIVPVLLDCMVYSEEDQMRLEADADDDANEEDEIQDVKPGFAKTKNSRATTADAQTSGDSSKEAGNGYAYADDDLSDGEIAEDDEDIEIDPEDEWNLRKCSAAALDALASHFGTAVFGVTLPWLEENFAHNDWSNREAAVLALGAIGPGCMDDVKPHLPQLVPFMLGLLNDSQPVVRQITCWALSRYAGWASQLDQAGKQQYFEPLMEGILKRMLDNNKKVQQSAASAFATLEEAAQTELVPYTAIIVSQFKKCFEKYKDKNMYILYDCVQTLAEYTGPRMAEPEIVNELMPALIGRWEKVQDQSREMFPLLECLAFIATSMGPEFTPFAKPLFMRCIRIIHQNLEDAIGAENNVFDQPDKDFLVTSLDLLSSVIQSLEPQYSAELAATAQPNMFEMLAYCMKDVNNDVKQSAYALLGDCAIYIFSQMRSYLSTILEILLHQLDLSQAQEDPETAFRVINNACWSCGEIAMREKEGMTPFVDRLLAKLASIMFSNEVPESLNENAAIAVGRLGIGCHQQLAPHLAQFAVPFLQNMRKVGWTDEKGHAYKGFANVVLDNPQAMEHCLLDFLHEMASAPGLFLTGMQDEGPLSGFERVIVEYKKLLGEGWDAFIGNLPPSQTQALQQLYGL